MWKIRKFSLQSGLELMPTRLIDEVLTNCSAEAGYFYYFRQFLIWSITASVLRRVRMKER